VIPRKLVLLCVTLDFIFDIDGKILFQEVIDNEMGMLMFSGHLNWQESRFFVDVGCKLQAKQRNY